MMTRVEEEIVRKIKTVNYPGVTKEFAEFIENFTFNVQPVRNPAEPLKAKESREKLAERKIAWVKENLKPGMIVKVSASSRTTIRQVQTIHDQYFAALHVSIKRSGNRKDGYGFTMSRGAYFSDHLFDKVVAVICDKNGEYSTEYDNLATVDGSIEMKSGDHFKLISNIV